MKKILTIVAAALLLLTGCSEKSQPERKMQYITFSLGRKQISTKVGTTMETLQGGTDRIRVHGYKGSAEMFKSTDNNVLKYVESTKSWYPDGNKFWKEWADDSYEFYANADNKATGLTITSPTNISIEQPSTYNAAQLVDYLLSYRFTCNGTSQPLVQLELEHAVAKVDILVIREKSIKNAVVTEIACSNFYRTAAMACSTHQLYDENNQLYNVWKTTLSGDPDTQYTLTNAFNTSSKTGGLEAWPNDDTHSKYNTPAQLSFLAIPQPLTKEKTKISLKYYVNETSDENDNYVLHDEDSFDLVAAGLPTEWESGHRYVYIIKINTGTEITGQVLDWVAVDYIEGTVLPDPDAVETE